MSEEEIMKILKDTISLFNNDTHCFTHSDDERVGAIQGLLDLYQKEKEKNNQSRIEIVKNDYVDTDKLALNYRLYKDLAYEYQGNCVTKNKLKEIIYPTPENPIEIEVQNSKMYKDLIELLED